MWILSSSSDPRALAVVDGTGPFLRHGPHYSRRTPGAKTFTGVGQEVVLITDTLDAVWAVVRQRTPAPRGSGNSRGRVGAPNLQKFVWRNMLFRNLGPRLSSSLIKAAVETTYRRWAERYGKLPPERLRTEVDTARILSTNPGYCYQAAGWTKWKKVGSKLYLVAPQINPESEETE